MINKNLKSNKAFTLIELLAVIIILGILMIIAIPSVTTYISNSRKSSYIDTAKNIIGAARTLVNSGKFDTYDRNVTYYIPVSCISSENGNRTPYGEFSNAYVLVTYNGDGYDYYFTGNDTSKTGIKKVIGYDDLIPEHIESEVEDTDIVTNVGIDGRSKVRIMKDTCDGWDDEINAGNMLDDDGTVVQKVNMMESRFANGFDLNNDRDFWAYRSSIRSITFQTTINPPSNYAYRFDVSANKDESIIAFLVNNSSWGYDMYLQSNGYIYANPDSSYYFAYMEHLEHLNNFENFKVDYVTDMSWMFAYVGDMQTFDVSSWNTSKVTNMSYMFTSIDDFFFMGGKELDLSSLDTSNVTDMSYMFYGLYYITGLIQLMQALMMHIYMRLLSFQQQSSQAF